MSVANGCWFVLTGTVAALVFGGAAATAWLGVRTPPAEPRSTALRLLARYWWTILVFWLVVLFGLELR